MNVPRLFEGCRLLLKGKVDQNIIDWVAFEGGTFDEEQGEETTHLLAYASGQSEEEEFKKLGLPIISPFFSNWGRLSGDHELGLRANKEWLNQILINQELERFTAYRSITKLYKSFYAMRGLDYAGQDLVQLPLHYFQLEDGKFNDCAIKWLASSLTNCTFQRARIDAFDNRISGADKISGFNSPTRVSMGIKGCDFSEATVPILHMQRIESTSFHKAQFFSTQIEEHPDNERHRERWARFYKAGLPKQRSSGHWRSIFTSCDFSESNFQAVGLSDCDFEDCDLRKATFAGAIITKSQFKNCDLRNMVFKDCHMLCHIEACQLDGARLEGCTFYGEVPDGFVVENTTVIPRGDLDRLDEVVLDSKRIVIQFSMKDRLSPKISFNAATKRQRDMVEGEEKIFTQVKMELFDRRWLRATPSECLVHLAALFPNAREGEPVKHVTYETTGCSVQGKDFQVLAARAIAQAFQRPFEAPPPKPPKKGPSPKWKKLDGTKKSIEKWNAKASRKSPVYAEADLKNKDLKGIKLSGFARSDFSGACLKKAVFLPVEFEENLFLNADLSGAVFSKVLWNCQLLRCNFSGANLSNAVFEGTSLTACNFTGANLSGAVFKTATSLVGVDFTGANLEGITFTEGVEVDQETTWPAGFNPPAHDVIEPDSDEEK